MIDIVPYGPFSAKVQPISDSKKGHCKRLLTSREYFDELYLDGFHFSNGFKCSDLHRFETIYNLSINIFETNFYQDQYNWKHQIVTSDISEKASRSDITLSIYKSHYFSIKKNVFLTKQHNKENASRKNPIKRVTKDDMKVSDRKDKNQYSFTGRII